MATHFDKQLFGNLIEQVESASQTAGGVKNAVAWISANTSDPNNPHKPFSFKTHPWQIKPAQDESPVTVISKCVQIGASELSIRLALAVVCKYSGANVIYTLPTQNFASKFSMNRVDPIISSSPRLKKLVSHTVNSNQLKGFGTSFLHIGGCSTEGSAISVPAKAIFIDELSFSDPKIVSVYMSRLGARAEHDRLVRKFSSPLYPNSGISAEYAAGDQKEYYIWHDKCSTWVTSDILELLAIPGYDGPIHELTVADLDNPRVKDKEAKILCPHCREEITVENMCNPQYREWVPKYLDREVSSYHAGPLVLAHVRTPTALLNDLRRYGNTQQWCQYALGHPLESSQDSILSSAIDNSFRLKPQTPISPEVTGAVMGLDVGRVSHLTIGKQMPDGVLHVLWAETIRQDEDNKTFEVLKQRFSAYRASMFVLDSGPDLTLVELCKGHFPMNRAVPAYFVRANGNAAGKIGIYDFNENEGTLRVRRTRALDLFVESFNTGKILLPRGLPVEDEIRAHLPQVKRMVSYDGVGEEAASWVKTKEADHFFFSLFYLWLAARLSQESRRAELPQGYTSLIGKVRLKAA